MLMPWGRGLRIREAEIDRELAEIVRLEIYRGQLEPAAWSVALFTAGGVRDEALKEYTRIRMQELSGERPNKSHSFNGRLLKRQGIRSVRDLLDRSNRGDRLNLPKPKLAVIWLVLLMIGTTGSALCLAMFFEPLMPDHMENRILLTSPLLGLSAVVAALFARVILPKFQVRHGWNSWVAIASAVACAGCLYLGSKLAFAPETPALIQHLLSDSK